MAYQGGAMTAMRTAPPRIRGAKVSGAPEQGLPRQSRSKLRSNRGHAAWSTRRALAGVGRVRLGRAGVWALVPLGHRTLGQAVDQRPDLAVRVPAVPPEGADEGQLALLGPSGDGLGRHLQQGRGLRRCQVFGLTRLGLAHCTPSYGHGPGRTWLSLGGVSSPQRR